MLAIETETTPKRPMGAIDAAFERLLYGRSLTPDLADAVAAAIIDDQINSTRAAALLTALRCKGEIGVEIAAFVRHLRQRMLPVNVGELDCIDTCGTGGDGLQTFNVSTAAALVVAAAGCPVAKHGNRSVSSRSGSTDVLEQLGIGIDQLPTDASERLEQINITFLHAPSFHPALGRLASFRRTLGFRTIFNIAGPLCNPAGTRRQVMGVFEERLVKEVSEAARDLGAEHMLVVHGADGADEISICDTTTVAEVKVDEIKQYEITPEQFGLFRAAPSALRARDAAHSAAMITDALNGKRGAATDAVALNAGAALFIGGRANDLFEGVTLARETIHAGAAASLLEALQAKASAAPYRVGVAR